MESVSRLVHWKRKRAHSAVEHSWTTFSHRSSVDTVCIESIGCELCTVVLRRCEVQPSGKVGEKQLKLKIDPFQNRPAKTKQKVQNQEPSRRRVVAFFSNSGIPPATQNRTQNTRKKAYVICTKSCRRKQSISAKTKSPRIRRRACAAERARR